MILVSWWLRWFGWCWSQKLSYVDDAGCCWDSLSVQFNITYNLPCNWSDGPPNLKQARGLGPACSALHVVVVVVLVHNMSMIAHRSKCHWNIFLVRRKTHTVLVTTRQNKGSHRLPNRMFFYTLCKRPLTPPPPPPPSVLHNQYFFVPILCCQKASRIIQIRNINFYTWVRPPPPLHNV